jgi:hypothetical protein
MSDDSNSSTHMLCGLLQQLPLIFHLLKSSPTLVHLFVGNEKQKRIKEGFPESRKIKKAHLLLQCHERF